MTYEPSKPYISGAQGKNPVLHQNDDTGVKINIGSTTIMKVLVFSLCVALSVAVPTREKRQANCVNAFQNVPNPCTSNSNRVYFPHPGDTSKFLQCDRFGRMYIVQCPAGEIYNQATTSCITPVVVTTASVPVVNNQCTPQNIAKGDLYFAISGSPNQFIECDLNGNANILTCPSNLVWDQSRLSCVYAFTQVNPTPQPGTSGNTLTGAANPCLGQTVTNVGLFFSHPDPNKFIQCDIAGDAYVLSCPSGLVWNEYSKTCVSPYLVAGSSG
ncbi:peritrophin-1-like [Argopecten irradians]|uniref:peritrophin-1-like n=1 Tax=Argopecten irradians TaxID=31199 RepID=UPI00371FDDF0